MDAIKLLTQDHRDVEKLFTEFERAGDRAVKTKHTLAEKIIEELTLHTQIEEEIFYPAVRSRLNGGQEEVLESVEEHHVAETLIEEIKQLPPDAENFQAKVTVLIESVRHHKQEEEQQMFPQVRKALGTEELEDLGSKLEQAKQSKQG